jgi:glycine betaine catabolism B
MILKLQIQNLETGETTFRHLDLSTTTLAEENSTANPQPQECSIGRANDCDITLSKLSVSRLHAKIHYDNKDYYYTDLGGLSGSSFNGIKLNANEGKKLSSGHKICIDNFVLLVKEIAVQIEQDLDSDNLPTQLILPKEEVNTQQYMPVACIKPSQFDRWEQGDLTVKCVRIIEETADAKTFKFVAEPPVLFNYKPGQFVTLDLNINGERVLRSYSISSTPSRPHALEITVKRVYSSSPDLPHGFVSNFLHDHLQVGDCIKINGPMGKLTCFNYPSPKLLFLSAGSGITPMMGMLRWIYDTGADCDVVFFHSARTANDVIFKDELQLMAARQNNFHLAISLTGTLGAMGLKGRLTPEMLTVICPDFNDRVVFVCGSKGFVDSTKKMFVDLEFPMDNYHQEGFDSPKKKSHKKAHAVIPSATSNSPRFGIAAFLDRIQPHSHTPSSEMVAVAAPPAQSNAPSSEMGSVPAPPAQFLTAAVSNPAPPDSSNESISELVELINHYHPNSFESATQPAPPENLVTAAKTASITPQNPLPTASIQVVFAQSGEEVAGDGEESVLEMAEQVGVKISSGCRMGSCGACKKLTKSGTVKMSDPQALEPSEVDAGYILCCIAYPQDRVLVEA